MSTVSTMSSGTVPHHVATATVFWGYGGVPTSISIARAAPWLSWVQTAPQYAREMRSSGMKVDSYINPWRDYAIEKPPIGYDDLKPGGAHAAAEARTCSGSIIVDHTYGGGYEADARSSAAPGHLAVWGNYRKEQFGSEMDALFVDDTGALGGLPLPCNYSLAEYQSATTRDLESLRTPVFVNTLGVGLSLPQVGYALGSNVLGAMCEMCIVRNESGVDTAELTTTWESVENAAIEMAAKHKIFWLYARPEGSSSEYALRTYIYASFLLTYAGEYSMIQESFRTSDGFPVLPETGLVPTDPLTTESSVTGYMRSGGAYMREYGACYYLGVNRGRCAVVVNPQTGSVRVPTTAYGHSLLLRGDSVLDGGSVSFSGGRITALSRATAAILFP
jgi:hypothetical protein